MTWNTLSHVATGDLATAALQNILIDDLAVLKTSVNDDGRIDGEIKRWSEEIVTPNFSAGTLTIDLALGNNFKHTLTANVATITVTNWVATKVKSFTLELLQDATGGRTVAFPVAWRWPASAVPTVTAAANKADILSGYSNDGGTNVFPSLYTVNA